jgi:hypothetical protein
MELHGDAKLTDLLQTLAECRKARSSIWVRPHWRAEASSDATPSPTSRTAAGSCRRATSRRSALRSEAAGVIFIDENGDGPGVRLRKKRP